MEYPLVSVIIPAFNAARMLPATISSVMAQSYSNVEIIVVDDGSTDNTSEIIKKFGPRIRYFRQENWGGPSGPRNVGLRNSSGDLIALFDSDDLMMTNKLAAAVDVFRHHPEVHFTFSNFQSINESGKVVCDDYLAKYRNFRMALKSDENSIVGTMPGREAYRQLLSANFIGTSSVVCRREVFDRVGLFDESMLNADDVDLWRRVAFAGFQFAYIDKVLHSYRHSSGGVTSRGAKRYPAILKGLKKQLQLDLEPGEIQTLRKRIYKVHVGYGGALFRSGDYELSRRVFREALDYRMGWGGVKGIVKSSISQMIFGEKTSE